MSVILCRYGESKRFAIGLILVISLLFYMSHISAQSFESLVYPMSAKAEHVKEIREKKQKWMTYEYYDTTGLLIRQINYYKKQKRADYQFEYNMTDGLLIIKEVYDDSSYYIMKYHYSSVGHVSKYEIFTNRDMEYPFVLAYNFVYKDGLLCSYDWSSARPDTIFPPLKTECFYNNKKQMVRKQEIEQYTFRGSPPQIDITTYLYRYDSKGQLTDQIVESTDKESVFAGVPAWSNEQSNKYRLVFSDYDRHGQWKTSYYVTKNSKKFRSNRKIKYWK